MTRLPDTDRMVIELISTDVENKIDELTANQDREIEECARGHFGGDMQLTNSINGIRTRYHNLFMIWLKELWNTLSYDEQIVFAKYYHSVDSILIWMDECQITAMKLLK